jgi:hypothetical protein
MTEPTVGQRIEQAILNYILACNDGGATAIAACFTADAVHYFSGIKKWSGATTIGDNFAESVRDFGQCWTVDQVLVDAGRCAATLEWTQFDRSGRIVRGVDWIVFEPQTLRIREVRPYVAAFRAEVARQELQDFDYAGRGYPTSAPPR